MSRPDVLIVGGGISGLATAWWLTRAGLKVEVWEAAERPGGKIQSRQQNGYLMEQAASMVMNYKPEVSQLIRETGLESVKSSRLSTAEPRRYLLHDGQLTALPMHLAAMVFSPLWSLRGKLRLLAEPFIPTGNPENETVSQFITRRLGREMLEKALEPFVAGTLAADPDLASAVATLPRLTALERRFGGITAGILAHRLLRRRTTCVSDTFSFHGGMATLIDNLAQSPGVELHTGCRVEELVQEARGWRVTATATTGSRTCRVPHLVLATPAPATASLTAPLDAELSELLRGIHYAPVSVVHIGMNQADVGHPLDGTGFLAPRQEGIPLTGNLWMSSLFAGRAPAGKVLLTAYLGGSRTPAVQDWDDAETADAAWRVLQPLLVLKGSPEMVRIDRHNQALPLYHGAYPERLQAIDRCLQQFPGLYLEANYRGGVSVRDRITRGHELARQILATRRGLIKNVATGAMGQSLHPVPATVKGRQFTSGQGREGAKLPRYGASGPMPGHERDILKLGSTIFNSEASETQD